MTTHVLILNTNFSCLI